MARKTSQSEVEMTSDDRLKEEIAKAIPCYMTRCDGFHVKRHGKYGYFYGCTNYPKCQFTTSGWRGDKIIAERVIGECVDEEDLYMEPW